MMKKLVLIVCMGGLVGLSACGDDDQSSSLDPSAGQGASCSTSTDCGEGQVCLIAHGVGACTITCTASGNECSGQASCGGVGMLEADFCQPPAEQADPNEPPAADEQPRIPCQSDEECAALHPGAICAQFQGARDCTILCTTETECDMPSMGGMSMDFLTCIADEGDTSRMACLPDAACFTNPMACVSMDTTVCPIPCAADEVCVAGFCEQVSATTCPDTPCSAGELCEGGVCVPQTTETCPDTPCPAGYTCNAGTCELESTGSCPATPCPSGFVCNAGTCEAAVTSVTCGEYCTMALSCDSASYLDMDQCQSLECPWETEEQACWVCLANAGCAGAEAGQCDSECF